MTWRVFYFFQRCMNGGEPDFTGVYHAEEKEDVTNDDKNARRDANSKR